MTGTSAKNPVGIFRTKRAKFLAIKYNLDLYNKNAYGPHRLDNASTVSYSEVLWIVHNLWLNHFLHDANTPAYVGFDEYYEIYNKLRGEWPYLFNNRREVEVVFSLVATWQLQSLDAPPHN